MLTGDNQAAADRVAHATALDIARRANAKIRPGLARAFLYNTLGIPLAALGMLSPVVAGGAMALSSVSVVLNALLLRRWRPARDASNRPSGDARGVLTRP